MRKREKSCFLLSRQSTRKKISSCFLSQAASSKRLTINGNFQDRQKREARSDHDNYTSESLYKLIHSF